MKKHWKILLALLAIPLIFVLGLYIKYPRINDVETGKTSEYPDLRPLELVGSYDQVFWLCARTAKDMPLWTLTEIQKKDGLLNAVAITPTMGFEDLVTIHVKDLENGSVEISVRSRSQVGKSDFGANARRIRSFFSSLRRSYAMEDMRSH